MWPRGSVAEQLVTLDNTLSSLSEQLREAKACDDLAYVAIIEQRYDEILDERLRIVGSVPTPRQPS